MMDFLDSEGEFEGDGSGLNAFLLGFGEIFRVHILEFKAFALYGCFKVILGGFDATHRAQVRVGVNGFSFGSSAEELCNLREAVRVGLIGEGEIHAISLAFASECILEVFISCHYRSPFQFLIFIPNNSKRGGNIPNH